MNRLVLGFATALALAGCGGGGGGGGDDGGVTVQPPANVAPAATAGADQTVEENTAVTLDGAASSDADGTVAGYAWAQTAGPTVVLTGATTSVATFTAPGVSTSTVLSFQLTVTDNGGLSSTDSVDVSVADVPNQNPSASAGADQSVVEGSSVNLDGSASSDADGTVAAYLWTQTAGPTVVLTDAATSVATFTAPAVSTTTVLSFQLTVTDNGGLSSTDSVDVSVADVPNQNPSANAGEDQSVAEGSSVNLDGSASSDTDGTIAAYQWTQIAGTAVQLNNANQAQASFTAPDVSTNELLTLQLMVTDDQGGVGTDTVDITVTDAVDTVVISGKVTYDHVKPNTVTGGLDYGTISQDPVRSATVQALDAAGMVLAESKTNDAGDYSLNVASNTSLRIRVRAEAIEVGPPSWDVRVVDNTNAAAPYVLDGSLATSGTADSTRNLNAASGWDAGTMSYTAPRAAGPFAILESIVEAVRKTAAVDATVVFPPVLVNWSPNNVPSSCAQGLAAGCVGTSFYNGTAIYILGAANNDTDEYDGHIIVHEWGHYFEDKISRSDSIGGPHSGGDMLDIRVAFGEGFGNALSGIITEDPNYRDSIGASQSSGFAINVETNAPAGWFDEATVQSLLYDLFDATADGPADSMELGWGVLYNTFASAAYRNSEARTSVFPYLTQLKADNPQFAVAITELAAASGVNGTDAFGAGETSLPPGMVNAADLIPVYTDIAANGSTVQLCSINAFGTYNRLSNRRFLKLNIATPATYRIQVTAVAGGDPDLLIFKDATAVARLEATGNEDASQALASGIHVLEVYDSCNVAPGTGACPAAGNTRSCFNITVTQM